VKGKVMETNIKICKCDSTSQHDDFISSEHLFPDGSVELLPMLCPDSDLNNSDLFALYQPILETLESNENWTMFALYSGMIAEIKPGLYFFSFGDSDEVGESNFYIKSDLKPVLEMLLSEWGPAAPPWREFLRSLGEHGYPAGYEPGSMVSYEDFFPQLDEEGLSVGVSFNKENPELVRLLKEL
jgi:hypothetical protein